MAKKEITLIGIVYGIKLDSDTVQNEIIGTLGFCPEVEHRINDGGEDTTEILPLTVAEAESLLEWCAENDFDCGFEVERN